MANGHPSPKTNPDYWRSRIEELDKRVCRDGAELQRTISEIVEANTGLVRAQVIEIIVEEFAALIEKTPVDSGRARAGWMMTDKPTEDEPPQVKKRTKGGGVEAEFASLIERHLSEATELGLTQPDVVYICNNVKYILALEAGWSIQAPQGFIALFMQRITNRLNQLK